MQIIYNGNKIQIEEGTRSKEILKEEIIKQKDNIIACKINNEIKSLNYKICTDGNIEPVYLTDKDGMIVYMRGIIYIVSKAFKELFPESLVTVNYQLYNSMFCNIYNIKITDEVIKNCVQTRKAIFDKKGDTHYDNISAFIKSMRVRISQPRKVCASRRYFFVSSKEPWSERLSV